MIQLTILVDNKVGKLAKILDVLDRENINIQGISTERGPVSEIRLILADYSSAKSYLEKEGFVVYETQVIGITLSDKPGELSKIANELSNSNVSIEYIYRFGSDDGKAKLVIHTSESFEKVRNILSGFSIS